MSLLLLSLLLQSYASNNVILFIGDGMGPAVVTASRIQYDGLAWDKFPNTAIVSTKSYNNHVTDSAAAATAMATGSKTDNGVLSLSPKDSKEHRSSLKTLADIAKSKNYSVGLVTTTEVTHATPAAFYSHREDREDDSGIAIDLFNSKLDLMFGGSTKSVEKALSKNPAKFSILRDKKDLPSLPGKPYLGIFEMGHIPYYETSEFNKATQPRLYEMTASAIDVLSKNKAGFFLMVEGGRIDHALHKNNIPQALIETSEFSLAVTTAMEKLKQLKKLDKTLIIITADHDTAGLNINGYLNIKKPLITDRKIATSEKDSIPVLTSTAPVHAHSAAHTAVDVSLYARGPCGQSFSGLIENTDIFNKIQSCLNK
ncbi:MAG: alkaline phosphatase [Bdellovibrionales bacterium]|nr:alkaline phosphatase [Bdellovibrionales bacterium]